ncbi:MAG: NfeD family protein [Candidatus Brocadiaceae bacterium]|jgi:membrane-bound serine protease (ClpP class)
MMKLSPSGRQYPRILRAAVLALLALSVPSSALAREEPQAYILRLDGAITEAYSKAVQRYIEKARAEGIETFILELNTPGGTVQASMELGDFIFQQEDVSIVAYINDQAYSGGTMVALACDSIFIDAATGRMGDVAPVGPGGQIQGEKIQSVIREAMLSYARARGYPEALVKAMVTKEVEVLRVKTVDDPKPAFITGVTLRNMPEEQRAKIVEQEVIVPAGELLTMHADRAVEYGFARQPVRSPQHLFDTLGLAPGRVERLYLTPSERVLTVLDLFSPLLIVGGFILLYIEITHPGFGLPGMLGIGCFVAFFVIKWTLHYAHMLEVLLFLAGLILILIEVFIIPGFGVVGISGLVLVFISLVLTFQQFAIPRSTSEFRAFQLNLLRVTGALAASVVGIALLIRYLPSLPLLSRVVHRGNLASAYASEGLERRTPHLAEMVGDVGVAATALRPAGRAEFGDKLLDVVTEGDFVEKGERVQIQQIHGNRIVVAPYREI